MTSNQINDQAFRAAYLGDQKLCETLVKQKGADINVVLMGASACRNDSVQKDPNDRSAFMPEDFKEYTEDLLTRCKALVDWAIEHGACHVFQFRLREDDRLRASRGFTSHKYTKKVSMINGPGDVAKGTFHHPMNIS